MKRFESRDEIDIRYKWDIEAVYESLEKWEEDFSRASSMIDGFSSHKSNLLESAESLRSALEDDEAIDRLVSKLYLYAKMKQDENTKDTLYQGLVSRMEGLASKAAEVGAFFTPEIMKSTIEEVSALLQQDEELVKYGHMFEKLFRKKPHTLTEGEEQILAMASEVISAPQNIFTMLNLADFDFGEVMDEKGEVVKLSHGNFVPFMESKDRSLRERVFKQYYSVFMNHRNSISAMLAGEVKGNIFTAKARKYDGARHASMFRNNIEESVYDSLISSVEKNIHHMHRYVALRKKALGLDEMHMYDIYTPLIGDIDYTVGYDEAFETVVSALAPLGQEYVSVVRSSMSDRWIDVYETPGKRSGAYSWGTYDTKPYIMLNYYGTLDNMFTLAHEMGHSMHSHMTRKSQPPVYGDYGIFLAEVASTTNEALLTDYLLRKETDKDRRLYILNHYLDGFRGTLFRQTMFAEFELAIHRIVEDGGAINADVLSDLYLSLNRKYYGDSVIHDEEIRYEWTRIPHFYYNFYVYQYATGFSSAISLSRGILEEGAAAVERYMDFLKAGSSQYPIDVLKHAGADMTSGEPVDKALELFGTLVDQFEKELLG